MSHRVALVRSNVPEKPIACVIRVKRICSVLQLLITANVVPSSLILFILIMEAIRSSEMTVLTKATRRHIPEDGILKNTRIKKSRYAIYSF
jgi:hypothetical protein